MNTKDFNNKINKYDPLKIHRTIYPTNSDTFFFQYMSSIYDTIRQFSTNFKEVNSHDM